MKYVICYLSCGVQQQLPNKYSDKDKKVADALASQLNKNRQQDDPYYWVAPIHEVIRVD